jgi:hypothetical protein
MAANTDLITGLCEDVVLGEVVSRLCRLPWNKRPLLSILNRTWMKVMTERFPIYDVAFHNIPNIQSNALILSHIKKTSGEEASYKLAGLWVCRPDNNNANIWEGAITVRLPEHPLLKVQKYTKFVCDNHRIFSLTPSVVTKEPKVRQNIYNVWMLDLRDFNIRWKSLPPLPRLWNHVYALSSLNGDESSYIWQRRRSDSSDGEGWKLSELWKGEDKNINSSKCEWHWEMANVNTLPAKRLNFDIMLQKLPLYVEIERRQEFVNHGTVTKKLYRRCPIPDYTLHNSVGSYIFMLLDGNIDSVSECSLCFTIIDDCRIYTTKIGLEEQRTRIVEEQELNEFVRYWNNEMRRQGKYEKANKWHVHSQKRSAIKVLCQPGNTIKKELKLIEKEHGEVVNQRSTIRVAQKGPIYGYSYLGTRVEYW